MALFKTLLEDPKLDVNGGKVIHERHFQYSSTLLHQSVLRNNKYAVRKLIENGAEVNAKDNYKVTPLHVAVQKGHEEIVRILLERKGIDVNTGSMTLSTAETWGHTAIAALLRAAGATN